MRALPLPKRHIWAALVTRLKRLLICALVIVRALIPSNAIAQPSVAAPAACSSHQVERTAPVGVQKRMLRAPHEWFRATRAPADIASTGSGSGSGSKCLGKSSPDRPLPPLANVAAPAINRNIGGGGTGQVSVEAQRASAKAKSAQAEAEAAERVAATANRQKKAAEAKAAKAKIAKVKAGEKVRLEKTRKAQSLPQRLARKGENLFRKGLAVIEDVNAHISPAERDTIILLAATALVTPIMGVIGLSPVLGFLFAGMCLGPAGLAVISDVETTTKLAELGVVFFLFEMGLELELERLKSVGRDAFSLGTAQFAVTGGLLAYLGKTIGGLSASTAIVLGFGLALSSSAFVIQLLTEKGELASRFGRATFGILLFQDLAVVPLLVLTPLLGGSGSNLAAALRLAAVKSAAALLSIFIVGRVLLQRAYKLVASAKDQTSFLAITLVTVLSMAGFTAAVGLSDTLGAFLAGVLLAETKYRYQIEADIAPFRGLLLGLFFITTGFAIDVGLAASKWRTVLGMALGLHVIKTVVTSLVCLSAGLKPSVAIRSGLLLSQGGEFAFVIFALAEHHGLLLPPQVKLLLTTVVLTMFLTPFLNDFGAKIGAQIERRSGKILLPSPDEAESSDFILLCGFGRVGQAVAELLTAKLVRYKAFDMDPYRVAEARELGLPVFFGDATRPEVLMAFLRESKAQISAVVVALDTERDCTRCVRSLRRIYPTQTSMPIFVRANDEKHRRKLAASGATALETGPQESALLLGGALLSSLGLPREEILRLIDAKRISMYSDRMKDVFKDEKPSSTPLLKQMLSRSPAEKAAAKAERVAAEIEAEIVEMEAAAEITAEMAKAGALDSAIEVAAVETKESKGGEP